LIEAEKLLGRPYRMSGRIAHGDKLGRKLGFPTANIHLHRQRVPLQGVFAIQLFGIDEEPVNGVANIGTRPTVTGENKPLLEVHLFNFNRDIYGEHVQVHFLKKIRSEQRFDSLDALTKQIAKDCSAAEHYFSGLSDSN
jgi:riboflavin kinase/FMN adenylyltransferase